MKTLKKLGICFLCLLLACSMVLTSCKKDTAENITDPTTQEGDNRKGDDGNANGEGGGNNNGAQPVDYASVAAAVAANDSTVIKLLAQMTTTSVVEVADADAVTSVTVESTQALIDLLNGNADIVLATDTDGQTYETNQFLREWLVLFATGQGEDETSDTPVLNVQMTLPQFKEKGNQVIGFMTMILGMALENAFNGDQNNGEQQQQIPEETANNPSPANEEPIDYMGLLLEQIIPANGLFTAVYGSGVEALINLSVTYDAATLADGKLTLDLNKLAYGIAQDLRAILNSINTEITLMSWLQSESVATSANELLGGIDAAELRQNLVNGIVEIVPLVQAFLGEPAEEEPANGDEPAQQQQSGNGEVDAIAILQGVLTVLGNPEVINALLPQAQEGQTAYQYLLGLLDETSITRTMLKSFGYDETLNKILTTSVSDLIGKIAVDDEGNPVDWKADVLAALDAIGSENSFTITDEPTIVYTLDEDALPADLKEDLALSREYGGGTPAKTTEKYMIWEAYADYYTETTLEANTTTISDLKLTFVLNAAGGSDEVQASVTSVVVSHEDETTVRTETGIGTATLQLGVAATFADISGYDCIADYKLPDVVDGWVYVGTEFLPVQEGEDGFVEIYVDFVVENGELTDMTLGAYQYDDETEESTLVQTGQDVVFDRQTNTLVCMLTVMEYDEVREEERPVRKEFVFIVDTFVIDEESGGISISLVDGNNEYAGGNYIDDFEMEKVYSTVSAVIASLKAPTDPAEPDVFEA